MARTNPPEKLSSWLARAAVAPFRASINGDCEWGTNRPAPDLISFSRISPGGRMLLAFDLAEVRDYFVDGHLDQGAQIEPDSAARAGARRPAQDHATSDSAEISQLPLERLSEIYKAAQVLTRRTDDDIALHVLPRIAGLREAGTEGAAAGLVKALPSNTVTKMLGWDALGAVDKKVLQSAHATALDGDLAALLLAWQKASRRQQAIEDIYGERAMAHGQELFNSGLKQDLTEFIATVTSPITRAYLTDIATYGTPATAADDEPSP